MILCIKCTTCKELADKTCGFFFSLISLFFSINTNAVFQILFYNMFFAQIIADFFQYMYMYLYCSDFLDEKKATVLQLFPHYFLFLFLCSFRIITHECLKTNSSPFRISKSGFFIQGPHANCLLLLSVRLKH